MRFAGDDKEKNVLFMCVENAGRSQIAEGFFRKYAPKGWTPLSAGSKPISKINPVVVQAMKEIGIDISNQQPKQISEELISISFMKISMGCMDQSMCPSSLVGNFQDWHIEDPKGQSIEKVREIRDTIEGKVKELVRKLES